MHLIDPLRGNCVVLQKTQVHNTEDITHGINRIYTVNNPYMSNVTLNVIKYS